MIFFVLIWWLGFGGFFLGFGFLKFCLFWFGVFLLEGSSIDREKEKVVQTTATSKSDNTGKGISSSTVTFIIFFETL